MMTMRWASFFFLLLLVAAVVSSTPQRNNLRRLDDADPEEEVEIEEALEPQDEEEEVAEPEEEVRGTEPPKEYPEEEERGTESPKEDVPPEEKPVEEGTSETTEPPAGDEEKEPTEPSEGTETPAEETEPGDDEDDADDDADDDEDDADDVEDVDADEDDADGEDDADDADDEDEDDEDLDELGTPAPTYAEWPPDDNTAKPPAGAPSGEVDYTPEPTYEDPYDEDYTDIIIDRPTPEPEVYVPTDDDPLKPQTEGTGYNWPQPGETPEEMVKDRNVLIALGCVFGVGVLLMIVTAQQMMENPDGCCASTCRLIVGCSCCIFRTICFPCRAICCPNKRGARHHAMLSENNNYTHDLELS